MEHEINTIFFLLNVLIDVLNVLIGVKCAHFAYRYLICRCTHGWVQRMNLYMI